MKLRNVAIIAHVDHGKTTLVDRLLQQSGSFRENQRVAERAMDSNDLERERGITILAKATSILWNDIRINIVDTPGHADFGGEVERILNMVDGAIVLVDAAEGPLPQTKFVVGKALKMGSEARSSRSTRSTVRTRARRKSSTKCSICSPRSTRPTSSSISRSSTVRRRKAGWRKAEEGPKDKGMTPLFDLILRHVAPPTIEEGPFRLLGTILEANPYLGRIVTGRITSGSVKPNQMAKVLDRDGKVIEEGRISKVLAFRGLERMPLEEAEAGDIVSIAGLPEATVAHTICAPEVDEPMPAQPIDPPTLAMTFRVNDSPLAGTEGDKVTSRMIRDRLLREARRQCRAAGFRIRRQGFDGSRRPRRIAARHSDRDHAPRRLRAFGVAPEGAVPQATKSGELTEPIEEVVIDVDEEHSGIVVQKMSERKGRNDRDAAVRRPSPAPGVLRADARPDRLSGRIADRYARHRDHEPHLPRICTVTRARCWAAATAFLISNEPAKRSPTRCGIWKTAAR